MVICYSESKEGAPQAMYSCYERNGVLIYAPCDASHHEERRKYENVDKESSP